MKHLHNVVLFFPCCILVFLYLSYIVLLMYQRYGHFWVDLCRCIIFIIIIIIYYYYYPVCIKVMPYYLHLKCYWTHRPSYLYTTTVLMLVLNSLDCHIF